MSTVAVQREIRQWLNVVRSQLDQVNIRLGNNTDPVELTTDGEAAYLFLLRTMGTLESGSTIPGDEVRRALDVFTLGHRRAFRPRLAFLNDRYQEVAGIFEPRGQPHTIPSDGPGQTNPGYVYILHPRG